ncbi:MAG: acyl-CoA dehydrogenase family protein [Desulfuromonadales bacterium]|nr:acyl-CoA dehydrogenase family protein [Desulfuromonadales bacterium]
MVLELTDEQKIWRETLVAFSRQELDYDMTAYEKGDLFPWEAWRKCAEMQILAQPFPEEYGGGGVDFMTTMISLNALGYACKDAGLVHAIATQILCGLQILHFGSERLKQRYLPLLCRGEKVFAQAITEPGSGSDALSMRTSATKKRDTYILSGSKTFITNGPIADVVIVFAVSDPEKKSLGGISCLVVEDGMKGFEKCRPLKKMGLSTLQNGELFFDNCVVAFEQLLGKEGQGAIIFNESMEWERSLLPAAHLGTMERILEISVTYAKERHAFKKPIGSYQSVANKLSSMKMNLELGKGILYRCAALKDNRKRAALDASICKLFISESLKQACLDAVQIHGGYGYMSEYEIERDLRDSIAATIYSGTSELQHNIIARFLGV